MSEKLNQQQYPEAVSGYDFQKLPSGLEVAEYMRSSEHPHPVNEFSPVSSPEPGSHQKTHGLVEKEHMVGDKKIILMQEYESDQQYESDQPNSSEANNTATRDRIDMEPDENGVVFPRDFMHTLKDAGVPDENVENIDIEYFYKKDDPDYKPLPDDLKDWNKVDTSNDEPTPDQPKKLTGINGLRIPEVPKRDRSNNTESPDETLPDEQKEHLVRKNEILEGLGIVDGKLAIVHENYSMTKAENDKRVPVILDAFDENGTQIIKFKQLVRQEDGTETTEEFSVNKKEFLLNFKKLEDSDKRMLSRKFRKSEKRSKDQNLVHVEYLEVMGAEKRQQLRAELRAENGEGKIPLRMRAKMLAGNIMTGNILNAENNHDRARRRMLAAGVGLVAIMGAGWLASKGIDGLTSNQDSVSTLTDSPNSAPSDPNGPETDSGSSGKPDSSDDTDSGSPDSGTGGGSDAESRSADSDASQDADSDTQSGAESGDEGDTDSAETENTMEAFDVQPGDGPSQIISRMPEAQGFSPDMLREAYEQSLALELFGTENTYMENGELRLSDSNSPFKMNKSGVVDVLKNIKAK